MELVEHDEELTCIPLSFEDRTHQASLRSRAIMNDWFELPVREGG